VSVTCRCVFANWGDNMDRERVEAKPDIGVDTTAWQARYTQLSELGTGEAGRAVKVKDNESGRTCCLKELLRGTNWRRLRHECYAWANLDHPGVVRTIDYDIRADPAYLVTEFVEGQTLDCYMSTSAPLTHAVVRKLAASVFGALGYIHSQHVIHRDLKPRNIILRPTEGSRIDPVVVGLGIPIEAYLDEEMLLSGMGFTVAAPAYMSPEQVMGEKLTGASDVYQLSQILWEILVGRPAFVGRSDMALMAGKLQDPQLEIPDDMELDARLASLIWHCTEGSPDRRPSPEDAVQVLAEIDAGPYMPRKSRPWWKFWGVLRS